MAQRDAIPSREQVPLLDADARIDHFRIVRLIDRGGMADVYLARDLRLGRRVALKLIRTEWLGANAACEHLLAEARATAQFSHPHIVTIYYVGEHEGRPYLALEYLEGDTLRSRLAQERPGVPELLRIGVAIAQAVAEAHRHGVFHRDLKPENVFLPRDGRLRVLDFGLAVKEVLEGASLASERKARSKVGETETLQQSESTSSSVHVFGSPQYMAPEQWRLHDAAGAEDVWALGVILYELVAGTRPYQTLKGSALYEAITSGRVAPVLPNRVDLPEELVLLIEGCLQKEAANRPGIGHVVEVLDRLLHGRQRVSRLEQNPFPGLLPYTEKQSQLFFGRDSELAAFMERIRVDPVLPVIGPSGAGKSSFVRAGVIPRLREQGFWRVLALRPGATPFLNLAARVAALEETVEASVVSTQVEPFCMEPPAKPLNLEPSESQAAAYFGSDIVPRRVMQLAEQFFDTPGRLGLKLQQISENTHSKILLFVDQLEELYTLGEGEQVRERFMQALGMAAVDKLEPVRVIFTLRDDFLGRLAEGQVAREALSHVTVMRSPGAEALRDILEGPPNCVGFRWEDPQLVDRMVNEVRGEQACLPLLQFATQVLWERRDREQRVIRCETFDQMGGVAGALAQHADAVLEGLTPAAARQAKQLLLRMVTPEGTRQVLSRSQLLAELAHDAEEVLARLVKARLVTLRRSIGEEDLEEAEVELVHESLIGAWGRLSRWIGESQEEMAFVAEISQAARLWDQRGRREEEVWQGDALHEAQRRLHQVAAPVPALVQSFIQAGQRREDRMQRRATIRRISLMIALAAVAVASVVVAWQFSKQSRVVRRQERIAQREKRQAQAERQQAEQRRAEAQREGARAALARGALVEARAKLRGSLETLDSPLARALWWQLKRHPLAFQMQLGSTVYSVSFSPDGKHLALGCQDTSIYVLDVETLRVRFLRGHSDQVIAVSYSPDGRQIASSALQGEVRLWDVARGSSVVLKRHKGPVLSLAFRPDGRLLASADHDGTIHFWDPATRKLKRVLKAAAGGHLMDLAFSPDGKRLVTSHRDRSVRLWDPDKGTMLWTAFPHRLDSRWVAFSPNGRVVASGGLDSSIALLDAHSGKVLRVLRGHRAAVSELTFSPNGRVLASGGLDNTARLWDPATGREIQTLRGHQSEVRGVAFSPDGQFLATGSLDESIRLWQLAAKRLVTVRRGHTALTYGIAFHPQGKRVASGGFDRTLRIWDVATGEQAQAFKAPSALMGVAWSPDGKLVAAGSTDTTIRLWQADSGEEHRVLRGHAAQVLGVTFSPDGRRLASTSYDRTARIWDVGTGEQKVVLRGHRSALFGVAFDPSGQRLATAGQDRTIRLWRVSTGGLERVLNGHTDEVRAVAFTADGRAIYSAGSDGSVRKWNISDGTHQVVARHSGRGYFIDLHPDGKRVGVPCSDRLGRIFGMSGAPPTLLTGHRAEVNFLRFSRDGRLVATTSDDGTFRLWEAATGRPYWRAPIMLRSRPELLTHQGWLRLSADGEATAIRGGLTTRWRKAVSKRARSAAESPRAGLLCVRTHQQQLEIWNIPRDRRLQRRHVAGLDDVVALPHGCLTLARPNPAAPLGAVQLHAGQGKVKTLHRQAVAMAWSQGRILVATETQALVFDPKGRRVAEYRAPMGVQTLALVGRWLVFGNRDGNVELLATDATHERPHFTFEDVPSSPVVGLLAGPMSTLVVGFANGRVGIFNLANGKQLFATKLHGPVRHLHRTARRLYAATELGDHLVLDLSVFDRPYCELMREVWSRVPIVWEGGLPVRKSAPRWHRCQPKKRVRRRSP